MRDPKEKKQTDKCVSKTDALVYSFDELTYEKLTKQVIVYKFEFQNLPGGIYPRNSQFIFCIHFCGHWRPRHTTHHHNALLSLLVLPLFSKLELNISHKSQEVIKFQKFEMLML